MADGIVYVFLWIIEGLTFGAFNRAKKGWSTLVVLRGLLLFVVLVFLFLFIYRAVVQS